MPAIHANGITLEYESFGNEARPVILLIMGLGLQMIAWHDSLCQRLADRGFRVIRFDNRDCGLSTAFDDAGTPNIAMMYLRFLFRRPIKSAYSLDDMARDAAGLLDALHISEAHVVGASMGGMIAQNLTALYPSRVLSLTSIMSTTGKRSLPKPRAKVLRAILAPPPRHGDIQGAVNRLFKLLHIIGSQTYPPHPDTLRAFCTTHVMRSYRPQGMARQLVAIGAAGSRSHIVETITRPTLVIHGAQDPLLPPECGRETARRIPGARLAMLADMGHDLPEPLWPHLAELIATHCETSKR